MHSLSRLIAEHITNGLTRRALRRCSEWAEAYRVMGKPFPGPWRFKYHPWLRDMHDSRAQLNIGQKAAQMGFSEAVLNIVLYNMDLEGNSCLYILPSQNPDASQFSTSRFDPALQLSEHLSKLFSDVKNVGHKRAGSASLYIRGSRSESGLKGVPASVIILDELDEMTQENIPLAFERSSGQLEKLIWEVSTPKIENTGINREFNRSTKNHFFFPCPACSKQIELTFPESIVITADDENDPRVNDTHLVCTNCASELPHKEKSTWLADGQWVSTHPDREVVGWHVNQLYSTTVSPKELALAYFKSLYDKASEQQFYNSKLGVTHSVQGSKINDGEINERLGNYALYSSYSGNNITTMGVDIGSRIIHYEIDEWYITGSNDINISSKCRIIAVGTLKQFEELDALMRIFSINYAVVDANPERRKAYEFAMRFWGRVRLCFYGKGMIGKSIQMREEPEPCVTVDRTSWLDLALGRFHMPNRILLPHDIPKEYREHIKSPGRVYENDAEGNPVGRYISSDDDHYAHARVYSEIALPLAGGNATTQSIRSLL